MANTVSGPRFFDSPAPFNPINPHGAKAKMPVGWKSPLREPLFQIYVLDKDKGYIPIGPKMRHDVANELHATVVTAIKSGKITGWSSPTVMPAVIEKHQRRVLV